MKGMWRRGRRGLSSIYSSLLALTIILAFLSLIILNYYNYNVSLHALMEVEQNRLQEELIISDLVINETAQTVTHVVVNNTGTIDIIIRAIYVANSTTTVLICDPFTYMDTHIPPDESLSIPLPETLKIEPGGEITVVTERGVKTKEYEGPLIYGPPTIISYDTSKFYIGPFMLVFEDFRYHRTFANGILDPDDYWHEGWIITKGFEYCCWNLTVTNVDDRNITINQFSSFTLVPNDTPSNELTWYLEPTNQTDLTMTLTVNQTQDMIYKWTTPKTIEGTPSAVKMVLPETACMGFLTFYGVFHEHDGTTTPYAQTIPFEAVKVVSG